MSASEKLKALKPEGLVVTDEPDRGYTDAVCLSIPAHAAVVAVVEAAEQVVFVCSFKEEDTLAASLAALEEALK